MEAIIAIVVIIVGLVLLNKLLDYLCWRFWFIYNCTLTGYVSLQVLYVLFLAPKGGFEGDFLYLFLGMQVTFFYLLFTYVEETNEQYLETTYSYSEWSNTVYSSTETKTNYVPAWLNKLLIVAIFTFASWAIAALSNIIVIPLLIETGYMLYRIVPSIIKRIKK